MSVDSGYRQRLRQYSAGLLLSLALTSVAIVLVLWATLPPPWTRATVLLLALLQIVVQLRCFLHVGYKVRGRDQLWLVLFSALVVLIMVGGTLWVYVDQMQRM